MFSKIGKAVIVGSVVVAGLGVGARDAAADAFSVSVHTPNVSAGYSNHGGHDSGYVSVYQPAPRPVVAYCPPPAPVYCPPPVVVYRPVVVREPVHVCHYDTQKVARYYVNECGRRVWYSELVRVRTCDDYHHAHSRYQDDGYERRGHGDKHYKSRGRGNGHDGDRYARESRDDDDRHHRHGRDGD